MSQSGLPPFRALQAFEAVGRLGSVRRAAQELGVTPGAISQQLKLLEAHVGATLLIKQGRNIGLHPQARGYHDLVTQGIDKLTAAQGYAATLGAGDDLVISGLPTVLLRWLNPILHRFQDLHGLASFRLEATHTEPDPELPPNMLRITYGAAADRFPHARQLFRDHCFPVCSPDFLTRYPEAAKLENTPLIAIDWGASYRAMPGWGDWFHLKGRTQDPAPAIETHSLSGSAIESAVAGQGVVLAQSAFVRAELETGRLVRLSKDHISLPDPYYVCWGSGLSDQPIAQGFLGWLQGVARDQSV